MHNNHDIVSVRMSTNLGAHRADQLGLVLALEQVYNEGVVSLLVDCPGLISHKLAKETFKFDN